MGVIYNRERRLADRLISALNKEDGLVVGDNAPFAMTDNNVYTVPFHGERRGIPTVEMEIRQDQIGDSSGQDKWASLLAPILHDAVSAVCPGHA